MNDPCIVYEVGVADDLINKETRPCVRYFKKDKTHVDFLTRACILPYIEASELYKSLNAANDNIKMVTLRELLTESKYRDVLKMVIENRPN
jgi:hypothetical protein